MAKLSIKKFEKYTMDIDYDISEEYAKHIISKYIDKQLLEDATIESVFYDVIKDEGLENEQKMIRTDIILYITNLLKEAKKIRTIQKIDASKYNL